MASSLVSMVGQRGSEEARFSLYFLHLWTLVSTPNVRRTKISRSLFPFVRSRRCARAQRCTPAHAKGRALRHPKLRPKADSIFDESHKEAYRCGDKPVIEVKVRMMAAGCIAVLSCSKEKISSGDALREAAKALCGGAGQAGGADRSGS